MDININTVAATVIRCTSRKHKQILSAFIESHSYSAEELTTLLAGLLPSPIESGVTIASQQTFISELSHALYLHQHPNDADKNQLIDARKLIRIVQANFKKQRKSDEELYCKAVKTNLTENEYFHLLEAMESYHYKSASRFLRDVITQKLTIKPQQSSEITDYFKQTKHIANIMASLIEEENPLHNNELAIQLGEALHSLQQTLQTTRNLAIDAHNAQTAELLAMHYLDSNALRALYRNKLEQEDRRDDI